MKKFTVILLAFLMITGCGGMGKVANLKSEFIALNENGKKERI